MSYIGGTTRISDNSGTDELLLSNTPDTTNAAKNNLYLLMSVNKDYVSQKFDLIVTDEAGKNYWTQWSMFGTGVKVVDNHVEKIYSSDGYYITSDSARVLAQQAAAWLTTNDFINVDNLTQENRENLAQYLKTYAATNDLWVDANA